MSPELQDDLYLTHATDSVEESLADYSPELLYHIRPHGETVIERSVSNRQILVEAGIERVPSLYVATVQAADHDAGFYRYFTDPAISKKFSSPEAYAAFLSDRRQLARGVDEITRKEITQGIMGTKAGVRCRTWGQFILCEADMHTTTLEDRTQMKEDTNTLRYEYAELKRDLGDIGFKIFSLGILATYNQVNLAFPGIKEAGDIFTMRREQMRQNIFLMGQDIVDQTGEELKELILRISPPFLGPVLKLFGISKGEIIDEKAS